MTGRILFVDDEPMVLAGFRRNLGRKYDVHTQEIPEMALMVLAERGPFDVVVSDMRMPGMSGVEFLEEVRLLAPGTVRLMVTGTADIQTAADAVNRGCVFRFLFKPCTPEALEGALEAALEQRRLIQAEADILEQTLRGCVEALASALSLAQPAAFGRALRVQRMVRHMSRGLAPDQGWIFEISAMLSHLGCVALPAELVERALEGGSLEPAEREAFDSHPRLARRLLEHIPRLLPVSQIIGSLAGDDMEASTGSGDAGSEVVEMGRNMLSIAMEMESLHRNAVSHEGSLEKLRQSASGVRRLMLDSLADFRREPEHMVPTNILPLELRSGMQVDQDIRASHGELLVSRSQPATEALISRLRTLAYRGELDPAVPIRVLIESTDAQEPGQEDQSHAA